MGRTRDLRPGPSPRRRRSNQSRQLARHLPSNRPTKTLPLQLASGTGGRTAASRGATTSRMTHVLLIEDSENDACIYKDLLQSEGYKVEVASTGEAGLARAQSGEFDVVLTDLHLSGARLHEGYGLVEQLHRENPHLPVILMTGAHTAQIAIAAIKLGAFDY